MRKALYALLILHFVIGRFILNIMTRTEFIEKMKIKGMRLSIYNKVDVFLSCGMETIGINEDDSLGLSSPAGNFKYKTFDDFINGKHYWSEKYSILD